MLRRSSYLFVSLLFSLLLQACGDDSGRSDSPITDYENYWDLQLSSLEVTVDGEATALNPAFTPERGSPYRLEVDADAESISLRPTLRRTGPRITIARRGVLYEDGVPQTNDDGDFIYTSYGEEVEVASGELDTKTLYEGDNVFAVRVYAEGNANIFTYSLFVHRPSTNADLLDVFVRDSGYTGTNTRLYYLTLSPEFESDVYTYTATASYGSCSVAPLVRTAERYTQVALNGAPLANLTLTTTDLEVGANEFVLVSTAEVGEASKTYTVTITRQEGTEAQIAENANLDDLSITGGEFTNEFRCLDRSYGAVINNSVSTVSLTATPEVEGATLRIGDPDYNSEGVLEGLDDAETMTAGEPFEVAVEVGNETKVIEVTSSSGDTVRYYMVRLSRLETNRVYVETAEELQTALRDAQPGDEIILTGLSYEGIASAEASGSPEAAFYSAQSGTIDKPIRLRNAVAGVRPELGGDADAILRLEGDYWRVSNLHLTGGRNGLILDGASYNTLNSLAISGVLERGVQMRNGSSHNILQRSLISDTGSLPATGQEDRVEAVVIGSAAEDWATAPEGSLNPADDNNIISGNLFGPDVRGETIEVKEGTSGTQIRYNLFNAEGMTPVAEGRSFVVVQGNDVDVAYNTFDNPPGEGLMQVVITHGVERDWVAENWGENARVFQNKARLNGQAIPMVNSTNVVSTLVADNSRLDGVDVSYTGLGIDESFSTPVLLMKNPVDTSLCLMEVRAEGEANGYIRAQTCDSSADQQWQLVNDADGFIFIAKAGEASKVMQPHAGSYFNNLPSVAVTAAPRSEGPSGAGYVYRWQPIYTLNGVSFANRGYSGTVVMQGTTIEEGLVTLQNNNSTETQSFILEEI